MNDERCKEAENKVLPIEPYLKAREEGEDGISQLLSHMRQVRDAVPVNRRLQVELRKKLMERQSQLMAQENSNLTNPLSSQIKNKALKYKQSACFTGFVGLAAVLLLVIGLTSLWHCTNGIYRLEAAGSPQELTSFWTENVPLKPSISPDGSKVLVERNGGLVLLSNTGKQLAHMEAPEGTVFRSPSWSPDGKQISFVVAGGNKEEIKQMPAEELVHPAKLIASERTANLEDQKVAASLLAKQESAASFKKTKDIPHYTDLKFSPDGKNLAYVASSAGGTSQVWVRQWDGKEKLITEGDAPTWSPNGKYLVVQRPSRNKGYELWLINIENSVANLLGQGEQPTWAKNGYLAFTTEKTEERILTFLPNGEPQYTVRQQVPEIRTTYLGEDGSPALKRIKNGEGWLSISHLLVVPESRISGLEMNWLRQQEISGSNTPKTLVLNEILKCEGQDFGPDGSWLLFSRRDGDTVTLLKVRVEERWEKERD